MISIIIPCHNCEHHIDEAVASALNQSYHDIEIICINDGSTDNTAQKLEKIRLLAPDKIKIIKTENKGACAARNLGLKLAKGEYIQYLDSDDLMNHNKLSEQIKGFNENIDLIVSDRKEVNEDLTATLSTLKFDDIENNMLEKVITKMMGMTGVPLYKKSAIEKIDGYREDLETAQDWDFHIRLSLNEAKVKYIPGYFYLNRKLSNSLSSDHVKVGVDMTKVISELKNEIKSNKLFNKKTKDFILDINYNAAAYATNKQTFNHCVREYKWWNPSRSQHHDNKLKNTISKLFGINTLLWIENKRNSLK